MLPDNTEERYRYLLDLLQNNLVEITFTKVNGETRTMPCTLVAGQLPTVKVSEGKERKRSNESISVWCTDKNEWRSFRVDNVTNVSILAK